MNLRRGGTNTGFGTTDVLYVLEVFLMTFTHFQVSCAYVSYKYNTTFLHLDDCKQDIDPDVLAFLLVKYGCDAPGFYPEEFGALAPLVTFLLSYNLHRMRLHPLTVGTFTAIYSACFLPF